ncbi:MAG: WecB/TagA/CpsF family glycosyltransferase [Bryobacteraceae bacterium]
MRGVPEATEVARSAVADRLALIDDLDRRFSAGCLRRRRVRGMIQASSWLLIVQVLGGAKRMFDFTLALVILLLTSLWWVRLIFVLRLSGRILDRTPRVGRWGQVFDEYSFSALGKTGRLLTRLHLRRTPVLLNILKGDMSFVGPRAVSPGELSPAERLARRRYDVRCGLICLWWLRQRSNIGYSGEAASDADYVEDHSLWSDAGIALRAIPAVLYGGGASVAEDAVSILGIRMHNLTMSEAVDAFIQASSAETPSQVCFVNADCVNISFRDPAYHRLLAGSGLVLADGIGMKLAGKLLRSEIRQNVNGTDLFPRLCEALEASGAGLYLLGGRPGIPEGVQDWIAANYPRARVCGLRHGYFSDAEETGVIEEIRASGASILLVAMGAPRQEKWIADRLSRLGVPVAAGVGGLFDFYSGRIPRAPQWLREAGMEWIYRFCQEPGRMWKRYFVGNLVFLFRVLRDRQSKRAHAMDSISHSTVGNR